MVIVSEIIEPLLTDQWFADAKQLSLEAIQKERSNQIHT